MQNYNRIYNYYYEFWKTVYEVYARQGVAYKTTYYRINTTETVWDNDSGFGGPYEMIGPLSGLRWTKILFFPVYFVSEVKSVWEGRLEGLVNPSDIDITIPSDYGFIPMPGDMLTLDNTYINTEKITNPIFMVSGTKKQTQDDLDYWQAHCNVRESKSNEDIESQVTDTLVFYDYDKKIHTLNDSISLTRILNKNQIISDRLKNLYDRNSGLYFI